MIFIFLILLASLSRHIPLTLPPACLLPAAVASWLQLPLAACLLPNRLLSDAGWLAGRRQAGGWLAAGWPAAGTDLAGFSSEKLWNY